MKRKKDTIPSAFENVLSDLGYGNVATNEEVTDMSTQDTFVDVELNKEDEEPSEKLEDEKNVENTHEDNTDIPEEVLNKMNNTETNDNTTTVDQTTEDNITDADITEAKQVGALFDAVVESFGWNIDDIEEDSRPVTVDGLTDYIRSVVEENSKPDYADERIEQLDAYVKNGGKFEDFYAAQQQQINYDTIDLRDESNQRTVIRELLRTSGYTDEQINNKIDRYESADMLEEEAEDALSRLKVIKQ